MEPAIIIMLSLLLFGLFGIGQIIRDRKKRSSQLAMALAYEKAVKKNQLKIEHVEVFDNRIIALDRIHKIVLFFYQRAEGYEEVVVPLLELASCRMIETHNDSGYIKTVYLQLLTQANDSDYKLCFYDEQSDKPTSLLPAMRRARNWKQRIEVNRNPGTISLEAEYVF